MFVGVGYGSVLYFRIKGQNDLYSWDTKHSCLGENFMDHLGSLGPSMLLTPVLEAPTAVSDGLETKHG